MMCMAYDNFQSVTRDQTLSFYTQDAKEIRKFAGLCLKRVDLSRKLRLLGVRVGSLVKHGTAPEPNPSYIPDSSSNLELNETSPDGQTQLLFTDEE